MRDFRAAQYSVLHPYRATTILFRGMSVDTINSAVETLMQGANTIFSLIGAILVLAMHACFAFLEVGTVRKKNQGNQLVKIRTECGISTLAYDFIGHWIALR